MKTGSLVGLVAATIVVGLLVDTRIPVHGQTLTNLLVFAVYGFVLWKSSKEEARQLLVCMAFGLLGELVLCFGWGLYTYRQGNLPLFVPPGHALLFLAGSRVGPLTGPCFSRLVVLFGSVVTGYLVLVLGYQAELLWFGLFVAVIILGKNGQIYSVMLVMALALELLGTYLGAWTWAPRVPYVELSSSNPPLSAGAFYCCLDLLVFATVHQLTGGRETSPDP